MLDTFAIKCARIYTRPQTTSNKVQPLVVRWRPSEKCSPMSWPKCKNFYMIYKRNQHLSLWSGVVFPHWRPTPYQPFFCCCFFFCNLLALVVLCWLGPLGCQIWTWHCLPEISLTNSPGESTCHWFPHTMSKLSLDVLHLRKNIWHFCSILNSPFRCWGGVKHKLDTFASGTPWTVTSCVDTSAWDSPFRWFTKGIDIFGCDQVLYFFNEGQHLTSLFCNLLA